MKSVLEELYYGNLRPFEERRTENSDDHIIYMEEFRRRFLDTLTESQRKEFFSYECHMSEATSDAECKAFVKGFRLGLKILLEVLQKV